MMHTLGSVMGGYVMRLVDMCSGRAAWQHSRRPVATAAIEYMSFLQPVHIGHVLILKSSVNRAFGTVI
jgi:acyl-CoA hydrolase